MKRMALTMTTSAWTVLALAMTAVAQEDMAPPPYTPPAAFVPFQQLDGTWLGTATHADGKTHDTRADYHLTAMGSALAETLFVDSPHEMVTVYFTEGDDLKLTHYCGLANQPTMRSTGPDEDGRVTFTYTGGTNIDDPAAPHMHQVVYEFLDPDHINVTWTLYAGGEPAQHVLLDLHRDQPTPPKVKTP